MTSTASATRAASAPGERRRWRLSAAAPRGSGPTASGRAMWARAAGAGGRSGVRRGSRHSPVMASSSGQVGLARAVRLDAPPLGDPEPIAAGQLRQEPLDRASSFRSPARRSRRRSAGCRSWPTRGSPVGLFEIPADGLPPARLARWASATVARAVRKLDRQPAKRRGPRPVAAAVPRLDEARAPGIVGECPPQLLDARRERRVTDHRVPPHGVPNSSGRVTNSPARSISAASTAAARGRQLDLALARPAAVQTLRIETVAAEVNLLSHQPFRVAASSPSHLRRISPFSWDFGCRRPLLSNTSVSDDKRTATGKGGAPP